MGRKFCVDKGQHCSKVMNDLYEMRKEGNLCDFTIKVGESRFQAHKNVLSAGSEYFRAMFNHDTLETRRGEVELKDMDSECFESCLDFIYTAEFVFPDKKSSKLLYASQILQLNEITLAVINELESSLTVKNFFETRNIAVLFSLKNLITKCHDFECRNFMAISDQPDFQSEEKSHLVDILSSTETLLSEKEKLEVSLKWAGSRVEAVEHIIQFLKLIDLKDIPADYIENLMENNVLISSDFKLYKIFTHALKNILKALRTEATTCGHDDEALIEANDNHEEKSTLIIFNKDADCLLTFDSSTNEVTKLHEVKFNHLGSFTALSLNSFIYVFCANKSVYRLKSTDRNSEWEKLPDMITDHGIYPPSVSALCSLFVIGRYTTYFDNLSNVVEQFVPITNQWIRLEDKPDPICCHSLVTLNDSIYCIGSRSANESSFCKFIPMSQEWIDLEPMKNARDDCGAVAIGDKIFVFGGVIGCLHLFDQDASNKVECFDIATSQWSALSPMPDAHYGLVAKNVKGWIYVVKAGRMFWVGKQSGTMLKYDVRNDQWHKVDINNIPPFQLYTIVKVSI